MSDRVGEAAEAAAELLETVAQVLHLKGYAHGLNPAQWAALRYFARAGGRTVTEFTKHYGTTKGTASSTVSALVRKNLLARERSLEDQRSHLVQVTPEGELRLRDDPHRDLHSAIRDLDAAEQLALVSALEVVLKDLLSSAPTAR